MTKNKPNEIEKAHLEGRHKLETPSQVHLIAQLNSDCGYCQRRVGRLDKKVIKMKAFQASNA